MIIVKYMHLTTRALQLVLLVQETMQHVVHGIVSCARQATTAQLGLSLACHLWHHHMKDVLCALRDEHHPMHRGAASHAHQVNMLFWENAQSVSQAASCH